ncbi:beta-glucosidase [Coniochaeta ligniaria NRRL 30616]|uniref:beta-glucosidase n=1 Tax=Coniochaeta ligniaria NRRL 30616 TaxID=1408157 RepID=A0A1J7JID8_9PEZI|nr:beta-glucosidase [Coniochaeta ligniaria NRRL 30616]
MADIDVEAVLSQLSLQDKVSLLSGIDFWHTHPVPSQGIPSLRLTDGPNGVRGTKFFNGVPAACFPCGTALGSTFNAPLLRLAGRTMGLEAIAKGAHCILGPTINTQRSPLGGRGFESLGEDPVLAGLGAAEIIGGIQETGVQACVKHFVCNDQEHRRNAVQAIVSERALREVYGLGFQLAIKGGDPGAVMTGYNGVNGVYCSESRELLEGLLRREWGFGGLVMSDWFGTYSTTQAVKAGLDLEMPGPSRFRGEGLKFNVQTDKVREWELDERVRGVLGFVKRCAGSGVREGAEEGTADTPETRELLRRVGGEGVVLLKNEGGVLPFKGKGRRTVVVGPNARVAAYHGGGSASLKAYYAVTPMEGIEAKVEGEVGYSVGCYSHKMLPLIGAVLTSPSGEKGMRMRVYNESPGVEGREKTDELVLEKTELLLVDYKNPKLKSDLWYADFEGSFVPDEDGTWEFGVVVCGTARLFVNGELVVDNATTQRQGDAFFGSSTVEEKGFVQVKKGETYEVKVEFASAVTSKLAGNNVLFGGGTLRVGACKVIDPKKEIAKAAELAKGADQVIICAGLNADWETEGSDRENMDLPAPMDEMIAAVAAANKNTVVVMQSGTPVRMPWIDDVAAVVQAWYGGNETGNVIADVLFGDVNPSGKLSLSFPKRVQDNPAFLNFRAEGGRTVYGEDVYVGYRYYEFVEREVLFPFGHGLSYTTFEFQGLQVAEEDGKVEVSVTVKNTGAVKGAEVVQVYVAPKQAAKVNRPRKELKGFTKVELAPGESKRVTVDVETKYAASYWDEERSKWCAEKGEYEVIVANTSDVRAKTLTGSFTVAKTFWWTGL